MQTGKVYWITGLPGAGKTTLAKQLVHDLRQSNDNVVHLDGDELRDVMSNHDYSYAGRLSLAKKYASLTRLLYQQDMIVVVSTVSLFHEIHQWNRNNISNYIEVYLAPELSVLSVRNQKGLYNEEHADKGNIVGQGITPELPLYPNFTFSHYSLDELGDCIDQLLGRD